MRRASLLTLILVCCGAGVVQARSVPASPSGPAQPAGGWALQYGDAFSRPLGSALGDDNTLYPNRYDDCSLDQGYNPDEMEVFSWGANTIGDGLAPGTSLR